MRTVFSIGFIPHQLRWCWMVSGHFHFAVFQRIPLRVYTRGLLRGAGFIGAVICLLFLEIMPVTAHPVAAGRDSVVTKPTTLPLPWNTFPDDSPVYEKCFILKPVYITKTGKRIPVDFQGGRLFVEPCAESTGTSQPARR